MLLANRSTVDAFLQHAAMDLSVLNIRETGATTPLFAATIYAAYKAYIDDQPSHVKAIAPRDLNKELKQFGMAAGPLCINARMGRGFRVPARVELEAALRAKHKWDKDQM
jgi:hypothetical protein